MVLSCSWHSSPTNEKKKQHECVCEVHLDKVHDKADAEGAAPAPGNQRRLAGGEGRKAPHHVGQERAEAGRILCPRARLDIPHTTNKRNTSWRERALSRLRPHANLESLVARVFVLGVVCASCYYLGDFVASLYNLPDALKLAALGFRQRQPGRRARCDATNNIREHLRQRFRQVRSAIPHSREYKD